jgi:RES domain-containing protein
MTGPSEPPVVVWRIATDTPDYTADDLSGKGAEVSGGRWNHAGTPMVYASTSRALACLESIVHLAGDKPLPLNRYLVELRIPADSWRDRASIDPAAYAGWDAEPVGMVSLDWGTQWAAANSTLLAEVPSVVVPEESNVLLNPRHPDAGRIAATRIRKWLYDVRLRRS